MAEIWQGRRVLQGQRTAQGGCRQAELAQRALDPRQKAWSLSWAVASKGGHTCQTPRKDNDEPGHQQVKGTGAGWETPPMQRGGAGEGRGQGGKVGSGGQGAGVAPEAAGLVWCWPSVWALDGQARKLAPGPKPVLPKCDTQITSGT